MDRKRPDLTAGLEDEQRRHLGDLRRVEEGLAGYLAPDPGAAGTEALLAKLLPLLEAEPQAGSDETLRDWAPPAGWRYWLQLTWAQRPIVEPTLAWAAGLLVVLAAITAALGTGGTTTILLLLISPALAAAGVAYLFRPATRTLWELEKAAPIRALELLYLRLTLLLAGNLLFILGMLGALSYHEPRLVLWRMVLIWLGPMLCLVGGALYCALRWGAVAGIAAPLVGWAGYVALGLQWSAEQGGEAPAWTTDLLVTIARSDAVLLLSVVTLAAGLMLLRWGSRLAIRAGGVWN